MSYGYIVQDGDMITNIKVSGFKSLTGFEIELRPGLNVLVGPNGAGKTNFLRFIEFISSLAEDSLISAVSRVGGAGEIFHREPGNRLSDEISFSFSGGGPVMIGHQSGDGPSNVTYTVSATIRLNESGVYFSQQSVYFCKPRPTQRNPEKTDELHVQWNLDDNDEATVDIPKYSKKLFDRYIFESSDNNVDSLKKLLSESKSDFSNFWIVRHLSFFFSTFSIILADVGFGRAYNINPSKVREPEDIAREPSVDWDGGGVAASLFSLKGQSEHGPLRGRLNYIYGRRRNSYDPQSLDRIAEYLKLANDYIFGIDARNDPLENKIRVTMSMVTTGGIEELPISLLSDGTVKWLALVTAIVMKRSSFVTEEPENFLHPRLQQDAVRILRAQCEASNQRYAILTTHSETLLNALYPEEIIIVQNDNGRTSATRPQDTAIIDELINSTGFGLGYFYVTGSFS